MTWQPANEGHSIERASISFAFAEALPTKPTSAVVAIIEGNAKTCGLEMVASSPMPFQINVQVAGQASMQPLPLATMTNGGVFRRIDSGRILDEVTIDQSGIVFSVFNYSRWADFIERAKLLLSGCLEKVSETVSVVSAKLEYWDRFDRIDDPEEGLVNRDSVIIGQAPKDMQGSWHTHVGYYLAATEGSRVLINANVDVIAAMDGIPLPPGIEAQARIYTLGAFQYLNGSGSINQWSEANAEMGNLHDILKETLSDLITDKLEKRINLRSDSPQS